MCWWISVWVPHVHLQNATINHSATACNTPRPWQQRMDEIKEPLCINTPPCPVHTTGNCFTTNANTNDIMTPAQPSSTYEKHHTDKLPIFIYENNRREDGHGLLKQKRKLNTTQQTSLKIRLSRGLWQNLNIKMFPLSFSIHSMGVGLFKKYNASSFCTESKPPAIIFKTTETNRKTHPHQRSRRRGSMCHYLRLSIFQQGTFKFLSFGFLRHMACIFTQASADRAQLIHFTSLPSVFPDSKANHNSSMFDTNVRH